MTGVMHLAAAVPTKAGYARLRPCVVVAGGREPPHWESYPGHQFIHTIGMLPCCETGGCWRAKTVPLKRAKTVPLDKGDKKDSPESLCKSVVDNRLPRCMDMITAADVIHRMEGYFNGGTARYLTPEEVSKVREARIWK